MEKTHGNSVTSSKYNYSGREHTNILPSFQHKLQNGNTRRPVWQ